MVQGGIQCNYTIIVCFNSDTNLCFTVLDSWRDVVDGNCQLEQGYELTENKDTDIGKWGDEYDNRIRKYPSLNKTYYYYYYI